MVIEELQSGRYRYKRLLGSGGMGDVYLMQDTRVFRQVAIKVMRAESALISLDEKAIEATRLFQREARAIAALEHPSILPLYDFGEETGSGATITYMVMPYCPAGSLENWLRTQNEPPLSPPEIAALIEQAAEALQYAHEHEVIHLDVKPSNFLLRTNRKKPRRPTLLLADFGIARNFSTVANSSRTIRGTPTSMAPEQWSGNPVFASDQYALAVMAYELLAGRPPFIGSLEQLMYRHFTVPAPAPRTFNPRLPAELDPVLLRALAKQPEERFSSIADFATAFVEAAQQPATPVEGCVEEDVAEYATVALSADINHSGVSRLLTLADDRESLLASCEQNEDQPAQESSDEEDVTRIQPNGVPQMETEVYTVAKEAQIKPAPATPPIEPISEQGELVDVEATASAERHVSGEDEDAVDNALGEPEPASIVDKRDEPVELSIADELSTPVEPASVQDSSSLGMEDNAHDLPTLVARESLVRVTEAPFPVPVRRAPRSAGLLALISALALCVLLGGGIFALLSHQNTPVQSRERPPVSTSTPRTRATVALSPTPVPGLYIAGTYNGSMSDLSLQHLVLISIAVTQIQGQGVFKGTVTFNHTLPDQQIDQLSGTIDPQGKFSFTVQQPAGQVPYVFYGSFNSENDLKGDYCNSSAGTCQAPTGYFNVGPREAA